jgi:hypothetical protein
MLTAACTLPGSHLPVDHAPLFLPALHRGAAAVSRRHPSHPRSLLAREEEKKAETEVPSRQGRHRQRHHRHLHRRNRPRLRRVYRIRAPCR